ncbi:FixH family protein [Herbaspirillum sp. GCM10030257]|uniref:FixH family protein n=1 Tax=Herbaspirillum sp. GCM10030257 TaxID=3273393 RepID=UPI0036D20C5E
MCTNIRSGTAPTSARPWYMHRWPWLIMLGPAIVVVAGIHTTWVAFTQQDALVVDDYYKEGKVINQDLTRDRIAADMRLQAGLRYDPAAGMLSGTVNGLGDAATGKLTIKLVHSTQPEKDIHLQASPDRDGAFQVALPMLDMARWQVLIESERRDWRLHQVWDYPKQRSVSITADAIR